MSFRTIKFSQEMTSGLKLPQYPSWRLSFVKQKKRTRLEIILKRATPKAWSKLKPKMMMEMMWIIRWNQDHGVITKLLKLVKKFLELTNLVLQTWFISAPNINSVILHNFQHKDQPSNPRILICHRTNALSDAMISMILIGKKFLFFPSKPCFLNDN